MIQYSTHAGDRGHPGRVDAPPLNRLLVAGGAAGAALLVAVKAFDVLGKQVRALIDPKSAQE